MTIDKVHNKKWRHSRHFYPAS